MKLKNCRTCDGCKAFTHLGGIEYQCELNFKFDTGKWAPLEPCPKPVSHKQFNDALQAQLKTESF